MTRLISNLVFEGGGVLGIAYLGALDYLYQHNVMKNISRCAGSSAGAIAACLTSFHLPFEEMKTITNSLDYKKVADKGESEDLDLIPEELLNKLDSLLGDVNCIYRLITNYGWYSSEYFYHWIQNVISGQFNNKKKPPYTFADFKNPDLHKESRSFHDLYVIGTNLSLGVSQVFSYETTPRMEVAKAVRISMSVPLFFEAIKLEPSESANEYINQVFCDGGVMMNYPIHLFDSIQFSRELYNGANMNTLGLRFQKGRHISEINNLLDFLWNLAQTSGRIQQEQYYNSPFNRLRSINIDTLDVNPFDFNIAPYDPTYQLLYDQGYLAATDYFQRN